MTSRKLVSIFFAAILVAVFVQAASAQIVQTRLGGSPWTTLQGDFRLTPAFPDTASQYSTFVFKPDTGDFDYIKVAGQFPYARYFSFNLYDFYKASPVDSLADYQVEPDQDHVNPFIPRGDRRAKNRSYTLWLVKEGVTPPLEAKNVIFLPPGIETLALFVRVYRPDWDKDSYGGVALPVVEALKEGKVSGTAPEFGLDIEALQAVLPLFLLNEDLIESWNAVRPFVGNKIIFNRVSDAGLFPNEHNEYIIATLPQDYGNKVAMVTIRPPAHENTYWGGPLEGGKDVRYWSFCTGGLGATATPNCLCDDQLVKNPDGTVTICIAPAYLKDIIERAGMNYMPWGVSYKPVMIHRHMLADEHFIGKMSGVPELPRPPVQEDLSTEYLETNAAHHFMWEYGPKGQIYTVLEFLRMLRWR